MEVEDILEQVDIAEYISQYVDLEERNGELWGLSPFKDEKTPSFSVNSEKQRFYDFSSGVGGNLIHFIRKYNNCGFIEAINIIKKYANITEDTEKEIIKLESTKVLKKFCKKERSLKKSNPTILPPNYMERYEFNKDKLQAWVDEGIDFDTMHEFGVAYDPFSDRIVFPVKSYQGDIINVCGRTLDKEFKKHGLRKYTYFKSWDGCMDTIYGISDNMQYILDAHEVILFEGCKSVLLANSFGIKNTGAILTSHLSPRQMMFLIKLGCKVTFALDKDVKIPSDPNIQKLKNFVNVYYLHDNNNLTDEKDSPVDKGSEIFKKLYDNKKGLN